MLIDDFVNFVREAYNRPNGFIPLHEPVFNGNEKKYLNECVDSTFVSSVGKFVTEFENQVKEYTGSKHAIAASSGTAALHIALVLSEVKPGDEVITQPLTFVATANAISYTGASPIFIDVDRDTMGLSPEKLELFILNNTKPELNIQTNKVQPKNLSSGKFITAVIPMHTFGHPARIEEIKIICDKNNIILIEDAAESLGSYYKGKHTGTFGLFGTLSFNGNKTITTGGGGMLITDDDELAKKAKHITTTAKVPHPWEYVHDTIGYNYRLTNLAAALGVAQMEQLDSFVSSQRLLASEYQKFFENSGIQFVTENENTKANYWLNTVILKDREERNNFLKETNDRDIMTRPIWELMNRLDMFKEFQTGDLSNSEWLADRVVNITSSVRVNNSK